MKTLKTTVLWLITVVIFTAGSTIGLAYTVNGHVECEETGMVPFGAVFRVYEVDPLPGGGFTVDEITLTDPATVDVNGDFTIISSTPFGSGGFEAGGPDLIFVLLQNINNMVETIYQEETSETHWNVADGSSFTLEIPMDETLHVVWSNPGVNLADIPINNYVLFTRIGICETANIHCMGSDGTSDGYHCSRTLAPADCTTDVDTDQPFGRTLDMFGWFGQDSEVDYYKVQYSTDGGSNWTDINTALPNKWYDDSDSYPLNWHWTSQSMGPFTVGTMENLYTIPYRVRPGKAWSYYDRAARFDTRVVPDGLCRVRFRGYRDTGGTPVPTTNPELIVDPNYGEIVLRIDNSPPTVGIVSVKLNGNPQPVCGIINFGGADNITVEFSVFDPQGHLRDLTLEAMYGHNEKVTPRPSGAYEEYDASHPSPLWHGNMTYSVIYNGSTYDPSQMPTCAYQFRLHAGKRTTNGYGRIYRWVEDTWHVTIQR